MKAFHLLLLAVLTLVATPRVSHAASTDEAEKNLKSAVDRVVTIAEHSTTHEALASGVRPILEEILNFETMTRRAVGPGWRQFMPDQQKEAVSLYTALIIRTYTAKFTPGELPSITYKTAIFPSAERVEIPTTLLYKGSRYEVIYRLEKANAASGWRITDVVIEGVSMIADYRTQFDSEFTQGGADAVLKALRRSVSNPQ